MKKWKFRVMTIIIIILGISLQFLRLFIENIEWLSYLGLPIMILGIFLFVNTFEFQKSHISIEEKLINKTEFPRDEETIFIDQHKYCDIQYFENCVKLFYSKDGKWRIIFCEKENSIIVRVQQFRIYTSDLTNNIIYCGEWVTCDGKDSFYADIELALNEYKNELVREYYEEDVNSLFEVFNCYPEFYAIINWKKESVGGRKTIPFGSRYWPQVIIHGSKRSTPSHSIVLRNINGISKYKTMAFVRYAFPGNPNDFEVNITFDVCEGNRKVATGIIKSKRENVDI